MFSNNATATQIFKDGLQSDVATSVDVPTSHVFVSDISAGSIVVPVSITGVPANTAANLKANPAAVLQGATLSQNTGVHVALSTDPDPFGAAPAQASIGVAMLLVVFAGALAALVQ